MCHVRIVDNGEPGTGNIKKGTPADEFEITIYDDSSNVIHSSGSYPRTGRRRGLCSGKIIFGLLPKTISR